MVRSYWWGTQTCRDSWIIVVGLFRPKVVGGVSVECYNAPRRPWHRKVQQLTRSRNTRQHLKFYVEHTFFDVSYSLRKEYDQLDLVGKHTSAMEIAAAYDGCKHLKDSTSRQISNVSRLLPVQLISVIGEIVSSEHSSIFLKDCSTIEDYIMSERKVMSVTDCRVFKIFVNIGSLKAATTFTGASRDMKNQAQMNTLYCAKQTCAAPSFKPIKATLISGQFQLAARALLEENGF